MITVEAIQLLRLDPGQEALTRMGMTGLLAPEVKE